MKVLESFEAVRGAIGAKVACLVPTMGFLHEGHLSLVGIARSEADCVVMSVFVNPLQFDEESDLDRYPRDLERDAALAEGAGVDLLFSPQIEEMYSSPPLTRVHVSAVSEGMEGAHRPGHFDGVATVVAKLFAGIGPKAAVLGRKDAQQLAVVRRMAADLSFPIHVLGGPTVREPDGLALSSRNVLLDPGDREAALSLSQGLFAAATAVTEGERRAESLCGIVADAAGQNGADLEYVALADSLTASPLQVLDREAFLAVAARVGPVRLIDNVWLQPDGTTDVGILLDEPSMLRR